MQGAAAAVENEEDYLMDLPPGFRFHPTDEEIIVYYLTEKVMNIRFTARAIAEVDMNKCEPWDLPKKAKMGEKEWFFFFQRDRKYPTGMRTNRATGSGYWKATGKDKEIYKGKGVLVGMKKTLVFYKGRAPKGEKTNWVMHEYRLEGRFAYYNFPKGAKDEWVVCRVFHKNAGIKKYPFTDRPRTDSFLDHILDDSPSLPPLMDLPSSSDRPGSSYTHYEDEFKGAGSTSSPKSTDENFSPSFNNSTLQIHDQNSFRMPTYNSPFKFSYQASSSIPIFNPQNSIPYPNILAYQQRQQEMDIGSIMSFPGSAFKVADQSNSGVSVAYNQGISDVERQCKVEQFSANNSLVSPSQETAISNDMATEISSKRAIGDYRSFEDLEGLSVGHCISDLDSLLDY